MQMLTDGIVCTVKNETANLMSIGLAIESQ